MCLFSQTVALVSDTHIFARVERDRQFLAYEMKVSTPKETAMILPLPVREGSGEDALRFIDLSAYPEFFDDLDTLFYHPQAAIASLEAGDFLAAPLLEVHRVGEFEASYVPSLDDFSRLDPRFNLPPKTWAALPRVSDFGFAVFQLRAGGARPIHPMAFSFPTRWADTAFFPTVHVHDGEAHEQAHFDHKLYLQLNEEAVLAPDDDENESKTKWLSGYRGVLPSHSFAGASTRYGGFRLARQVLRTTLEWPR